MTDQAGQRRPTAFRLDDPRVVVTPATEEAPRRAPGTIHVRPEAEPPSLPAVLEAAEIAPRRGFPWGGVFWASLGGLVVLGLGLSISRLIEDLFARGVGLGAVGLTLVAATTLALAVIVGREVAGLMRLAAIEKLHRRAALALISDDRAEGRAIVTELIRLGQNNPRLARARATLQSHADDIIDGADFVRLAEREVLSSLDQEARLLISAAAQRVSVVTAVSPRAAVDMIFVFVNALRLIRQLAHLYGGRPGALGMIRLLRHTVAHLAFTGGLAASDSLIQQVLGHGIAAKLSSRLGEGVMNGLLTARLGLAAVDVTRPLPFAALPRPVLADLVKDVFRTRDDKDG